MTASLELLKEIERRRVGARLTQAALASRLGVTQGHYSKVVGRIIPLSSRLAESMGEWIEADRTERRAVADDEEIAELARSIQTDARRLALLIRQSGG